MKAYLQLAVIAPREFIKESPFMGAALIMKMIMENRQVVRFQASTSQLNG